MSGAGFTAGSALWSATTDETSTWRTPPEVWAPLHREFGFGLDAAALGASALLPWWHGPDHPDPGRRDAFTASWTDTRAGGRTGTRAGWLNPPYGRGLDRWMELAKLWGRRMPVVALIMARTDTAWWHDHVHTEASEVRFVRGRVRFLRLDGTPGDSAPAPSAIIVWRPGQLRGSPLVSTFEQQA